VATIRSEFNVLILAWIGTALAAGLISDACSASPQGPAAASPAPAGEAAAANSVLRVEYATLPAGRTLVRVRFRTDLAERPAAFASYYPSANIVLDFLNFANESGSGVMEVHQRELRRLQWVRAGNRLRLIVELTRPTPHDISMEGRQLLITLSRPQTEN